jgi:hypothetical protein
MKKKAQIFICDQCGEEVSDGGETYIGGSPFNGWYHIERHGGSTDLASLRAQKDWDFVVMDVPLIFYQGNLKEIFTSKERIWRKKMRQRRFNWRIGPRRGTETHHLVPALVPTS